MPRAHYFLATPIMPGWPYLPRQESDDRCEEKNKPEFCTERGSLHHKQSVHDTLLGVYRAVHIVEDKRENNTPPKENVVNYSLQRERLS